MAYKTGEKPGKGTYRCTACGQSVVLDDTTDTLPPCPRCSGTSFTFFYTLISRLNMQIHLPKIFTCIHETALRFPFSSRYLVI